MTGFCSVEGLAGDLPVRIEMKTLNHRFLDVKLRLPRELSSVEIPMRQLLQSRLARGALEVKVERLPQTEAPDPATIEPNLALASSYLRALHALQKHLGLSDSIRTMDIATMPDVLERQTRDHEASDQWKQLEPVVEKALTKLTQMREHEGQALARTLREALDELQATIERLRAMREQVSTSYRDKITEKIKGVFEAHPIAVASAQSVLESRIAQELAILLDRTDIEEELTRFRGHLDHFRKVLDGGGPVGRKIDFILQELHREINMLGNKAQDFQMSEDVVQVKVRLEQLREQVMNLE
jgi:uncharacterized protein (TIGR00255 family)